MFCISKVLVSQLVAGNVVCNALINWVFSSRDQIWWHERHHFSTSCIDHYLRIPIKCVIGKRSNGRDGSVVVYWPSLFPWQTNSAWTFSCHRQDFRDFPRILVLGMKSFVRPCFVRLIWDTYTRSPRYTRSTTRNIPSNQSCKTGK